MLAVRLSSRAKADIEEIVAWTVTHWSIHQAEIYVDGLDEAYERIAQNPGIGRSIPGSRFRWRRVEHVSHVIIYKILADAIVIERVIHQRRLMSRIAR